MGRLLQANQNQNTQRPEENKCYTGTHYTHSYTFRIGKTCTDWIRYLCMRNMLCWMLLNDANLIWKCVQAFVCVCAHEDWDKHWIVICYRARARARIRPHQKGQCFLWACRSCSFVYVWVLFGMAWHGIYFYILDFICAFCPIIRFKIEPNDEREINNIKRMKMKTQKKKKKISK